MSAPHLVLIGCCAEKAAHVAPAREMYRSQLFRKAMAWTVDRGHTWRVISAAYGLIKPDEQLMPYDQTLRNICPELRAKWDRRIARALDVIADGGELRVTLLAGQTYAGWVPLVAPWCAVEQPMAGMSIGKRLQWLSGRTLQPALFDEAAAA